MLSAHSFSHSQWLYLHFDEIPKVKHKTDKMAPWRRVSSHRKDLIAPMDFTVYIQFDDSQMFSVREE